MKMFGGLVFPFDTEATLAGHALFQSLRLQSSPSEPPVDGKVVSDGWIYKFLQKTMEGKLLEVVDRAGSIPLKVEVAEAASYAPISEADVFAHCGTADGRL